MGGGAGWWLAAGIVVTSSMIATVAGLTDSLRSRLRNRRLLSSAGLDAGVLLPGNRPGGTWSGGTWSAGAAPAGAADRGAVRAGHRPVGSPPVGPPSAPGGVAPAGSAQTLAASAMTTPPATVTASVASAPPVSAPPTPAGGSHGPASPISSPAAAARPAPVEIRVLGPLQVRAPGLPSGPDQAALMPVVAMAALQPEGVPAAVMAQFMPGPGAAAMVAQQLRGWLGTDPAGQPRLCERHGAWRLAADVRVDWQVFRDLVGVAEPADDPRRFADALAMIRGELLSGVVLAPAAQQVLQPFLARIRGLVVQAVWRDIQLARKADDPARAEWAVRQGMTLLPRDEQLWQLRHGLMG